MAYIIIGLGNPGAEYAKTRHNAGRMAVELFAKQEGFPEFALRKATKASVSEGMVAGKVGSEKETPSTGKGARKVTGKAKSEASGDSEKVTLVIPEVSMNLSGKLRASFVKSVKAAQKLLVIRDDLGLAAWSY